MRIPTIARTLPLITAAAAPFSICLAQGARPDLEPLLQSDLNLRGAAVLRLELPKEREIPLEFTIPVGVERFTVRLAPHSIRSPEYTLWAQTDAGWVESKPGPVCTLRGEVAELPGSAVAGGMMDAGLSCRILLADDRDFWLEPIAGRVPGAGPDDYVLYTPDNLIQGDWRCGADSRIHRIRQPDLRPADGGVAQRGGQRYQVQLGTDADFEYFAFWGSTDNVADRIQLIINTMNLQYERDVDLTYVISSQLVRTTTANPYTSTNANTLLDQFKAEWNGNQAALVRDHGHLFTGKELDGNTIGLAFVGTVCGPANAYGLAQSDYNGNFMSACDVSAHEIGHNWDADHCTCSDPASTMNPTIRSINRFTFSDNIDTIGQITAFRGDAPTQRSCIATAGSDTGPLNNNCSAARFVSSGRFGFSTNGATTDGPSVTECSSGESIENDVWFRITPPCDGSITLSTCEGLNEAGFDTVLVVYTGECASLTQVACNDDALNCAASSLRSAVTFDGVRGTDYLVRIGGFAGSNGEGVLSVTFPFCIAPLNNSCTFATTVEHCDGEIPFSLVGAQSDGPIELLECNAFGNSQIFRDVWYRYVAPCSGIVRVETCGQTSIDTKIAVYTACPTTINQAIACNDDACGVQSGVEFPAFSGADYYIRIGTFYETAFPGGGSFTITNLGCPRPVNDDCANAVGVGIGVTNFSTVGACTDGPDEADDCNFANDTQIGSDIWFVHTASCTGRLTVSLCGSSYDTKLAVYDGPQCAGSPMACNDDAQGCQNDSRVNVQVILGNQYLIRIGGRDARQGDGVLTLTCTPGNDACADAADVSAGGSFQGNLINSTSDGSAGCGAGANDVWYAYTPCADGRLRVTTCGTHDRGGIDAGIDTVLSVHTACPGTTANQVACNNNWPNATPADLCNGSDAGVLRDAALETPVTRGETLYIRVSPSNAGTEGRFVLNVAFLPANNACADAIPIADGATLACNLGATRDGPPGSCSDGFHDVWYLYQATCDGAASVGTCILSTFDTAITVYRAGGGCPVTPQREVACSDNDCGLLGRAARVTFPVTRGQQFFIRLSSSTQGLMGDAVLNVSCAAPCPCDWNASGTLNSQDFFDFLGGFFAGAADFNQSGATNSQDFFDFLTCFFAPPSACN